MKINTEQLDKQFTKIQDLVPEQFAISPYSLAVFRILMGALLVVDTVLRARNFTYYYTDDGVLPWSYATEINPDSISQFPIWGLSSEPWLVFTVFSLAILGGIGLSIGWHSKFMVVVAFLTASAIDARNPAVTSYADIYYHQLLFFLMFLPVGSVWSVDALHQKREIPSKIQSLASFAILLQIIAMYVHNVTGKIVLSNTEFMYLLPVVLEYDNVTTNLGVIMKELPLEVLMMMSTMWTVLMLSSVLLLKLDRHHVLRLVIAVGLISGHGMMMLTVKVGSFAPVSMAALILFLNSKQLPERHGVKQFVEKAILHRVTTIATVCSTYGRSVLTKVPTVRGLQSVLDWVTHKKVNVILIIVFVSLVLVGGVGGGITVADDEHVVNGIVNGGVETIEVIGVDQPNWTFYMNTELWNTWYVFNATTEDGESFNAFYGGSSSERQPVMYERPYAGSNLHQMYEKSYRDRFFLQWLRGGNVTHGTDTPVTHAQAEYVCKNANNGDIESVKILFVYELFGVETVRDDSIEYREHHKEVMLTHNCN